MNISRIKLLFIDEGVINGVTGVPQILVPSAHLLPAVDVPLSRRGWHSSTGKDSLAA